MSRLTQPSNTFNVYKEIAVHHAQQIHEYYNQLALEEKIFMYYLVRASASANLITADQRHIHAIKLIELCELILKNEPLIAACHASIVSDVKTYMVYLWTNHGNYFMREDQNNKRTPSQLGLVHFTPDNFIALLESIGQTDARRIVEEIDDALFNEAYQPTLCVPGNIEQSAVNMYSPGFSEADYMRMTPEERSHINSRLYLDRAGNPQVELYSMHGRCSTELKAAVHWIKKACYHAEQYPVYFDMHIAKSLQYLIQFLETGQEEWFRQHSIEWLKTRSRIDYTFGFIESYEDPKATRGTFAAEVTIKTIDIQKISFILPEIENQLPIPSFLKRETFTVPNASINVQVFGSGDYGPLKSVAAYCLPNYEDIRAQWGSKQIIYQHEDGIGALLNPEMHLELNYSSEQVAWIKKHENHNHALHHMETLLTILHETIGHASGSLYYHTFLPGENLTIENTLYTIGDTIAVTPTNLKEFLDGYDQTIEELRAEIIALYVATHHIEEILATGTMQKLESIESHKLQEWLIILMGLTGYRRLLRQPEGVDTIAGDHSRANVAITQYLIKHKALIAHTQIKSFNGKEYSLPTLAVPDVSYAMQIIKELMIYVQTIKSTGGGQAAHLLIKEYGSKLQDPTLTKHMQDNKKAIMGDIKATASIYPRFEPIVSSSGDILDIVASWPADIYDQHLNLYTHSII